MIQGSFKGSNNGAESAVRKKRKGFILMEVIVAMTLLALIMTPLAAMVYKITARSHRSIGNTYLNAVLMDQINYLEAVPYDNLTVGTTTSTITAKPYPHTETVIVVEYLSKWQLKAKKVTFIVIPTNPLYKADTTIFMRSSANTRKTFVDDGV
jgi:Tfp pilus assembly protein PilV